MDGRMKDGQTLFYRTLQATLGVQKPTDMKTYRWTQNQRKNFKNQHCLLSMLVPQIECLYYPLNAEGVTEKGSHKIKQIIIFKLIYAKANSLFC